MMQTPPFTMFGFYSSEKCLSLYPQKRTCAVQIEMSAKGQEQTSRHLLDQLVGAQEECLWDRQPERFGDF